MESLQDEIREIRKQLRLAMNGVISTSMREKGIVYKLNFGVPYPEIKEIARKHKPNGELAAALWKEDIREFIGDLSPTRREVAFGGSETLGQGDSLFGDRGALLPELVRSSALYGGLHVRSGC